MPLPVGIFEILRDMTTGFKELRDTPKENICDTLVSFKKNCTALPHRGRKKRPQKPQETPPSQSRLSCIDTLSGKEHPSFLALSHAGHRHCSNVKVQGSRGSHQFNNITPTKVGKNPQSNPKDPKIHILCQRIENPQSFWRGLEIPRQILNPIL